MHNRSKAELQHTAHGRRVRWEARLNSCFHIVVDQSEARGQQDKLHRQHGEASQNAPNVLIACNTQTTLLLAHSLTTHSQIIDAHQ